MNIALFPACCGVSVLKDFGGTSYANYTGSHTKEEVSNFLKSAESRCSSNGFILAIINQEQWNKIRGAFRENGWKRVTKQYHPSHGQYIYLYIKNLDHGEPK